MKLLLKKRIVVEGGDSGEILSQFDGPVTFNNNVRIKDDFTLTGKLRILNNTESTSSTIGAVIVSGGVAANNIFADSIKTGNIQLAVTDDNTIDTSTGDLKLSSVGGSLVAIQTNTTITGILSVTDDITAFWTSDKRLKDNITPIDDPLTKVVSISGNTFDWNDKSNKSGHDVGLIAQEIEQVLPEAVVTRDNGYLAVDYHKVVPLLVEAIKELSSKVETLEQKLQDK